MSGLGAWNNKERKLTSINQSALYKNWFKNIHDLLEASRVSMTLFFDEIQGHNLILTE